ncbi:hypothetical protein QBZ16_003075 [Prototheca wickerhamii]|uniref:FMP27 GFWDK domain-containing protein n=1 Tax=Prototheca wickerhamii TaxID=3111 RepID=A0AAD9IIY2_PROWI|nr:hypothetical protein QBZ16_003075 [Prototheca wickerhamii]
MLLLACVVSLVARKKKWKFSAGSIHFCGVKELRLCIDKLWPADESTGATEAGLLSLLAGVRPKLPAAARDVVITVSRSSGQGRERGPGPKAAKKAPWAVPAALLDRAASVLQALTVTVNNVIVQDEVSGLRFCIDAVSLALETGQALSISGVSVQHRDHGRLASLDRLDFGHAPPEGATLLACIQARRLGSLDLGLGDLDVRLRRSAVQALLSAGGKDEPGAWSVTSAALRLQTCQVAASHADAEASLSLSALDVRALAKGRDAPLATAAGLGPWAAVEARWERFEARAGEADGGPAAVCVGTNLARCDVEARGVASASAGDEDAGSGPELMVTVQVNALHTRVELGVLPGTLRAASDLALAVLDRRRRRGPRSASRSKICDAAGTSPRRFGDVALGGIRVLLGEGSSLRVCANGRPDDLAHDAAADQVPTDAGGCLFSLHAADLSLGLAPRLQATFVVTGIGVQLPLAPAPRALLCDRFAVGFGRQDASLRCEVFDLRLLLPAAALVGGLNAVARLAEAVADVHDAVALRPQPLTLQSKATKAPSKPKLHLDVNVRSATVGLTTSVPASHAAPVPCLLALSLTGADARSSSGAKELAVSELELFYAEGSAAVGGVHDGPALRRLCSEPILSVSRLGATIGGAGAVAVNVGFVSGTLGNEAGIATVHLLAACVPSAVLVQSAMSRTLRSKRSDVGGSSEQAEGLGSPTSLVDEAATAAGPRLRPTALEVGLSDLVRHDRRPSSASWGTATPGSAQEELKAEGTEPRRARGWQDDDGLVDAGEFSSREPKDASRNGSPATSTALAPRAWEATISVVDVTVIAAPERQVRLWAVSLQAQGGSKREDGFLEHRAGVWASTQAVALSVMGQPVLSWSGGRAGGARRRRGRAPAGAAGRRPRPGRGARARATAVSLEVRAPRLDLPHDVDPGSTLRYFEIHAAALRQVLAEPLGVLKTLRRPRGGGKREAEARTEQTPPRTLKLSLDITSAELCFAHHPLEAWLATRAPLLAGAAAQRTLGRRVDSVGAVSSSLSVPGPQASVSSVASSSAASAPPVAASPRPSRRRIEPAASDLEAELLEEEEDARRRQEAWVRVQVDVAEAYASKVAALRGDAAGEERRGDGKATEAGSPSDSVSSRLGDLFRVSIASVHGTVVLPGDQPHNVVIERLVALDPASAGVAFARARLLELDLETGAVALRVAACPQPFVALDAAVVRGALIAAKQRTGPPATHERRWACGRHVRTALPVSIKGTKATYKFYTDLALTATSLQVLHGPGLEPALALMGLAGKRLAPRDPDPGVARPPPIPLGGARLGFTDLNVDAFKTAGVDAPGGTLLRAPLARVPEATIESTVRWALPDGRTAREHHLFPAAPRAGEVQEPRLPGLLYKACGLDLGLRVELCGSEGPVDGGARGDASPTPGRAQWATASPAPGSPAWEVGPESEPAAATLFLGDQQVQFFKTWIGLLKAPDPAARAVVRRGTFFVKKPRAALPKKPLPKLLRELRLSLRASPLSVVHSTRDPEDAAANLTLSTLGAAFEADWLLNEPVPSFLKPPPHARQRPPPTRVVGGDFSIPRATWAAAFAGAQAASPEAGTPQRRFSGGEPRDLLQVLTGGAARSPVAAELGRDSQAAAAAPPPRPEPSGASAPGDGGEAIMWASGLRVARELVGEAAPEAAAPRRRRRGARRGRRRLRAPGDGGGASLADVLEPQGARVLLIRVSDARLMVDGAARDALWSTIEHLVAAFTTSPAGARAAQRAACLSSLPTPVTTTAADGAAGAALGLSPSLRTPGGAERLLARWSVGRAHTAATPLSPDASLQSSATRPELLDILLQQRPSLVPGASASTDAESAAGDAPSARRGVEERAASFEGPEPASDEEEGAAAAQRWDDAAAKLRYSLVVTNLQVNLSAPEAQGRFLLAAERGSLQGLSLSAAGLSLTRLRLEEVQAYVAMVSVDPDAPPAWLGVDADRQRFEPASAMANSLLRRVFNPIAISLCYSKAAHGAVYGPAHRVESGPRGARPGGWKGEGVGGGVGLHASTHPSSTTRAATDATRQATASPAPSFSAARGEELVLSVPQIVATMEAQEFAVLVEVVELLLRQGPEVETVAAEQALLGLDLAADEEVERARLAYAQLRRELYDVRCTLLQHRRRLGLRSVVLDAGGRVLAAAPRTPVGALGSPIRKLSPRPQGLGNAHEALTPCLGALSAPATHTAPTSGLDAASPAPLLQGPPCLSRTGSVYSLSACSPTSMQLVLFDVPLPAPTDLGALLFGGAAEPAGGDLRAGEADACAARFLFASPSAYGHARPPSSHLLLAWGEERELALAARVRAARAELGELRAEARKRQRFARRRGCASIRGLSLDRLRSRDRSGSFKVVIHALELLDVTGRLDSAPGTAPGCILVGWNPDASWARDDMVRLVATFGVPTRTHSVYEHVDASVHPLAAHFTEAIFVRFWEYFFPLGADSAASADAARRQAAFAQSPLAECAPLPSPESRSAVASPANAAGFQAPVVTGSAVVTGGRLYLRSRRGEGARSLRRQRSSLKPKFKHFRTNRMHCRVTYRGYPIDFTDLKLVLDSRTYENFEGGWRDLLIRIKWDTVKSVLKSVTGLQGRKFKELLPEALPEGDSGAASGPGASPSKGILEVLGLKKGWHSRSGSSATDGGSSWTEEQVQDAHKARMLFGGVHAASRQMLTPRGGPLSARSTDTPRPRASTPIRPGSTADRR